MMVLTPGSRISLLYEEQPGACSLFLESWPGLPTQKGDSTKQRGRVKPPKDLSRNSEQEAILSRPNEYQRPDL
jgi:hypothetical protein